MSAATTAPKAQVATRVARGMRAFFAGTFHDGPKHTWHALKAKPVTFGVMLFGVGAVGAGARWLGVNPEPYMIALSTGALGFQIYKSIPTMRDAKGGSAKLRAIGANLVWPTGIALGSTGIGMAAGHGDVHAPATLGQIGKSGVQSMIISGDAPTILQTALDDGKH